MLNILAIILQNANKCVEKFTEKENTVDSMFEKSFLLQGQTDGSESAVSRKALK